jgi:hypothetical protein
MCFVSTSCVFPCALLEGSAVITFHFSHSFIYGAVDFNQADSSGPAF